MTDVPCPSCGLPISETAVAAGTCPCCGHRIGGGPVESAAPPEPTPAAPSPEVAAAPARSRRWAVAAAVVLAAVAVAGYVVYPRPNPPSSPQPPDVAARARVAVAPPPRPAVPAPPTTLPASPARTDAAPVPRALPIRQPDPVVVAPAPRAVFPPKPVPAAGIVVVASREGLVRRTDNPDGTVTVEVADLNGEDHVTLTGLVKELRLGGLNGRARLDASGLAAETVVLTELNGEGEARVFAPGGKVTVSGTLNGRSRLRVAAPGGEVMLTGSADVLNGEAGVEVEARRVEVGGMKGAARLAATLDSGGSVKAGAMNGRAELTYRRASATDPAPAVETGERLGGARVVEGK